MLEDQIQKTETDSCGIFQLYFYEKLFGPQYDRIITSHETLNKNTVQTLLMNNTQTMKYWKNIW